jgi:hypothetical protein
MRILKRHDVFDGTKEKSAWTKRERLNFPDRGKVELADIWTAQTP